MDEATFKLLLNGTEEEIATELGKFNKKNIQTFTFPDLSKENKKKLLDIIFSHLKNEFFQFHQLCLETIRILSRDKQGLDELFTQDRLMVMMRLASLVTQEEDVVNQCSKPMDITVTVEAQKCLCNLIYNSSSIQRICSSSGCIDGIMLRLRTYKDPNLPHEVKYFDMRMLFLLTALCAETRPKLRTEMHGLTYLMEVIDLIVKDNAQGQHSGEKKRFGKGSRRGRHNQNEDSAPIPCLDDSEIDLACEVLKVLFNLTCNVHKHNLEEEEEAHFMRLVSILHDILLCDAKTKDKKEELQMHTVNLLTTMPAACYEELLTPLTDIPGEKTENTDWEYEGMNMEAIVTLMNFLDSRLDKPCKSYTEALVPILSCLSESARANRTIRKYLKIKVLPPLKDVMTRPEEGTTLRNRLVKLMTSPSTDVKELVADFLFILCKENVSRLVKYTGYGNAAGLLANRGLMHGGKGQGDYSSESEDSDTEEYIKYKDRINPVLGCYQDPRPDPMEGMSEEQKEYEAIQLVNMMDRLAKDGVVQPMRIGKDGRPYPVEHLLDLQRGINHSNRNMDESDSD